jgi:hypothetical protein
LPREVTAAAMTEAYRWGVGVGAKFKRFDTEHTEKHRRTERNRVKGARPRKQRPLKSLRQRRNLHRPLPDSMKLNRPLPFDPAPRDLRMNRAAARFTKATAQCKFEVNSAGVPPALRKTTATAGGLKTAATKSTATLVSARRGEKFWKVRGHFERHPYVCCYGSGGARGLGVVGLG